MEISMIAAVADNNVIGKDNQLIWHLPDDLKFFKNTTKGHHIIMGRKNFEAIGRPLPHRTSIIITRQKNYKADGCIVVNSIEEAISKVKNDDKPFIIGGGEIYKQALPLATKLYITKVHARFEGDTLFPEIKPDEWKTISENYHPEDERHECAFSIVVMERC